MNSCILMAQIVSNPELRSTQDNLSVSSMMVEFESGREGEEPGKVQVEGWGNLAEEMKNTYSAGDKIIIEGRLSMNLFEMPEGYKEKRAKLVASRIYPMNSLGTDNTSADFTNSQGYQAPSAAPSNVVDFASTMQTQAKSANSKTTTPSTTSEPTAPESDNNEDWDEIPF
jgi:single-strand DNA-binding protein